MRDIFARQGKKNLNTGQLTLLPRLGPYKMDLESEDDAQEQALIGIRVSYRSSGGGHWSRTGVYIPID